METLEARGGRTPAAAQYHFAAAPMLSSPQLLHGNILQAPGMATYVMGPGGQSAAAGVQLAGHPGRAGLQLGGLPMQPVLIPAQDGSLQLAYHFAQPMDGQALQYQFITQPVIQESPTTNVVSAQNTTVHIHEPEVNRETDSDESSHGVVDNVSTASVHQSLPESIREPSPPSGSKATLDDPQRQCIIEFVDNMSPRPEQSQQHIANITYHQHPSPQQTEDPDSTLPTLKLKAANQRKYVINSWDDVKYKAPLDEGWGRHVKLRTISGLLRAEVIYITPAGRKLRTYGEVEKSLEAMDTSLTKENFSFSNKLQVGTFFLPCESQGGAPREATLDQVAQYKADIKEARMKSGRRNVMFIHQTIPDGTNTANEGITNSVTRSRGRPKKMKLVEHPNQTIVVTTPTVSSVIKDTSSCASNNNVEEVCISPTPLQIDLAPSAFEDNHEQSPVTVTINGSTSSGVERSAKPGLTNGPIVSPLAGAIPRRRRMRKSHNTGKMASGVQAKAVEAGLHVKRRRGRKSKAVSMLPWRGTVLKGVTSSDATSAVISTGNVIVGEADQGVICSATPSVCQQQPTTAMDKKQRRNMLLMKAKADKAKKRAEARRATSAMKREEAIQQRSEKRIQQKKVDEQRKMAARQQEDEDRLVLRQRLATMRQEEAAKREQENAQRLLNRMVMLRAEEERRMAMYQWEMLKAHQLKKPTEDLSLKETEKLPELKPLENFLLPSDVFADLLMVVEFGHAFSGFLEIDQPPQLSAMYSSLHSGHTNILNRYFIALLNKCITYCLPDGACVGSGQSLTEVDVNEETISELLRCYISAADGDLKQVVDVLSHTPLTTLSAADKISTLVFLINELLSSQALCKEIDSKLEQASYLRKEKWKVSVKLKRYQLALSSRMGPDMVNNSLAMMSSKYSVAKKVPRGRPPKKPYHSIEYMAEIEDSSDEELDAAAVANDEVKEDASSAGEDIDDGYDEEESDEDTPTNQTELLRRIKQLKEKFILLRSAISNASESLRTFSLGSDRYTRSFWLLPSSGGIFVEGSDTRNQQGSSVDKKPHRLSVIEEGTVCENPERGKRKLSVNDDRYGDDVFEAPAVKKLKEEDETDSDVDTMNLSLLSDVCHQAEVLNSQDEAASNHAQSDTSSRSPSPHTCTEPHPLQNALQPIRSVTDYASPKENMSSTVNNHSTVENSIEPTMEANVVMHAETPEASSTPDNSTAVSAAQSLYMNSQPTVAYLSDGSLVYSTAPQGGSMQYVVPQQGGGYVVQEPSAGDSTMQYLQAGQLIQGPDGMQYLVQNNVLPQSHNFAYVQMENGEQQLCMIANGGIPSNGDNMDLSDGAVYKMNTPAMEAMSNELECMPFRHNILLLMLEVSMQCQPAQEEKDTGPSLEELLAEVKPDVTSGWKQIKSVAVLDDFTKRLCLRGYREKNLFRSLTKRKEVITKTLSDKEKENCDNEIKDEKFSSTISQRHDSVDSEPMLTIDDNAVSEEHEISDPSIAAELRILELAELLEERLFIAFLHSKGTERSTPVVERLKCEYKVGGETSPVRPLHRAIHCIMKVEAILDRRFLMQPFKETVKPPGPGRRPLKKEEPKPPDADTAELKAWHEAVLSCQTASQLAVCMNLLDKKIIAWERSTTKVFCSECRRGDNESLLLLCDDCDKGRHTYCCTPNLEEVPAGDWYCPDCVDSGNRICSICDNKGNSLIQCTICSQYFHKHCLIIPPKNNYLHLWKCPPCKKHLRKNKSSKAPEPSVTEPEYPSKKRSHKEETNLCRTILRLLLRHEDALPFLAPVDKKKFPGYYKVITHPMDFKTLKQKLDSNKYPNKESFVADVQLIFANCEYYNEDDSEIGKLGHRMRAYFEKKWSELLRS